MDKDFNRWNQRKKQIESKRDDKFVHEREIWWCSLGVNIGSEQDGGSTSFERPVLILKRLNRATVIIVPLTSRDKGTPYHIASHNDVIPSFFIISQIRLISTKRLTRRIRKIFPDEFAVLKHRIVTLLFT